MATHGPHEVSAHLGELLVEAVLDEIRSYSLQGWLRFLSDRLARGKLVYVDLVFGCRAYMLKHPKAAKPRHIDFFDQRSGFLSDIYKCIGRSVTDARVGWGRPGPSF